MPFSPEITGVVEKSADLFDPEDPNTNQVYWVTQQGAFYAWTGEAWEKDADLSDEDHLKVLKKVAEKEYGAPEPNPEVTLIGVVSSALNREVKTRGGKKKRVAITSVSADTITVDVGAQTFTITVAEVV